MGKPMLLPDSHGRPTTFTFDEVNFSQSRRNVGAGDIPILLDHDPNLEVGKLRSLTPNREWWICSFELREDVIGEPFEVGQPVSVGIGDRRLRQFTMGGRGEHRPAWPRSGR